MTLSTELMREVRGVFEPRYMRTLSDDEVVEIADNLIAFMESTLKFRWRQINEKKSN